MAKKASGGAARGRKAASARGTAGGRGAGARKRAATKTARKAATRAPARKATRKSASKRTGAAAARKQGRTAQRGAARKTAPAKRTGRTPARNGARKRTSAGGRRPSGSQLSPSTARAKWIESPDERADRPGQTLATRSHEVIQKWAEERGAQPATTPGGDPDEPRVLRFDFPGFGGQTLQEISWDDWFRTFDDRNLVFVFQEEMKAGNQSNFFRLDNPEREDA